MTAERDRSPRERWRHLLFLVVAAVLFAAFLWVAYAARAWPSLAGWDEHITNTVVGWRTPGWSRALWLFTLVGDAPLLSTLSAAVVVLLAAWGRRAWATATAGGLLVAWGTLHVAKALVGRARPPAALSLVKQPLSRSLPSGHALVTLVFCGVLVYLLFRWIDAGRRGGADRESGEARERSGWWAETGRRAALKSAVVLVAAAVLALIGMSRVYLGVHWATDVIAGWCLGGALLALTLRVLAVWEKGGHSGRLLRRSSPWMREATRLALAATLALVVALVAMLTAWYDPLL